jgi:hypothetical protein
MSALRHTATTVAALAVTVGTFFAGAPAAFAKNVDPGDLSGGVSTQPQTPATVVSYGSPVWVFIVVAIAASLLTVVAILSTRTVWRSTSFKRASESDRALGGSAAMPYTEQGLS